LPISITLEVDEDRVSCIVKLDPSNTMEVNSAFTQLQYLANKLLLFLDHPKFRERKP